MLKRCPDNVLGANQSSRTPLQPPLDRSADSCVSHSHELSFKARTASEAEKWWNVIREAAGEANFTGSVPSSPVESRTASGQQTIQSQDTKQPALMDTDSVPRTEHKGSASTPGAVSASHGSAGGYGDMGPAPSSGSAGASPATGGNHHPTSGVDRAPGQY